ncbi:hypothetical protein [Modestobacter altitudinis]|uniref:hypothetical protein n=1 Tax=Modestobacter altitudinis TaxID=2213158 RepID=UPI00110D17C4|nr:hypothetical protein [Modestobacter altitudinis]
MTSPLRGDVLLTGFVLAVPVFLLGLRGEFTAQEVVDRLLWCLAAGWAVVAVVRFASTPPQPRKAPVPAAARATGAAEPETTPTA